MNRASAKPSYAKLALGMKRYARKSNRCSLIKEQAESFIEAPALEVAANLREWPRIEPNRW
jgi:hypothetical protein